jgi:CubicO group peptidase (beta-lactamase class C family)
MRGRYASHRLPIRTLDLSWSILVSFWLGPALAAQRSELPRTSRAVDSAAISTRGLRDRGELEAFIDGVMVGTLKDKHVAGAVVAIVKDGGLFFAKGYGFADAARHAAVDPARTLFRIGSITKLFTWTAVMQLVEAGKLDLDADVNRYLDFKIPASYPQPITLRHLMTHTPGFEDDDRDLWAPDSAHLVPMGRWLASHIPARVRPPGTYSSYSNYGAALAGYIVERVSGTPWPQYVQHHILDTLRMTQSSAEQPLPARLRPDMSVGYHYEDGVFQAKPWELITGAPPAGTMSASGTDIATFMLAHLGDGATAGRRILGESTARLMHARTFGHDPRLPGFALGFYEKSSHGLRVIGHGGDTDWFHSDLALIPSEHLGVFVSYNTDTGGELSFGPFLAMFLDHYYPVAAPTPVPTPDAMSDAARVAGEFWFNRRPYRSFQRALGLSGRVTVSADTDGSLQLASPFGDMRLVRVGPLLYQQDIGTGLVAFMADSSGRVIHGFIGEAPMMVMDRLPWNDSLILHSFILALVVLVSGGALWAAAPRYARRRLHRARPEDELPARGVAIGLAFMNLAFIVIVAALMARDVEGFVNDPPTIFFVALALPVLSAVLAVAAGAASVSQWKNGEGTRGARLRYDAVIVATLLFLWSLNTWNLLGWRLS